MTRKHWRLTLALVLALLGASAVAVLLVNYSPTQLRLPSCFFRKLTGLYCPGCGSTRALRRLLCADFIGAFRYNPAFALAVPWIPVALCQAFYDEWRGVYPPRRLVYRYALFLAILLLVLDVARNLPFDVCDWLRPPEGPCP